jgi:hypothetical protein
VLSHKFYYEKTKNCVLTKLFQKITKVLKINQKDIGHHNKVTNVSMQQPVEEFLKVITRSRLMLR